VIRQKNQRDEQGAPLCHTISMTKRTKKKPRKRKPKSTDWSLGQPLDFPKKKAPIDAEKEKRA
jgi:hypothetical protein